MEALRLHPPLLLNGDVLAYRGFRNAVNTFVRAVVTVRAYRRPVPELIKPRVTFGAHVEGGRR